MVLTTTDESIGVPSTYVDDILKRYKAAKTRKDYWNGYFEAAYE